MARGYHHITHDKRIRLDTLLRHGHDKKECAAELGVHLSTIYRELKRGEYDHLNSDYTTEKRYSPEIAEMKHQEASSAKGAPLKIGKNRAAAQFIEEKIRDDHYSPAAVCALLKSEECAYLGITFCRATIYKYIEDGNIFPTITNKNLPEKGERKRKYDEVHEKKPPRGRSIETRPEEVKDRSTMGHWEMDTVVGKKNTRARLLVLSERCSRNEIIIKIPDGTAASVVRAINRLERRYGASFSRIFQSITVDNGSEFADAEGIERSCRRKGKRTTLYFCHPYTACERGTNENINRMIRRHFPKGTNFDEVSPAQVRAVEEWINSYPREILGYKSAGFVFSEWLNAAS